MTGTAPVSPPGRSARGYGHTRRGLLAFPSLVAVAVALAPRLAHAAVTTPASAPECLADLGAF